MLEFIIGLLVGGFVAFFVFAICSINKSGENREMPPATPANVEQGDSNAGK